MLDNDLNSKQKIINAIQELLHEHGDVKELTIRRIAKRANVGIGLINYHFKSKENLINESIQIIINNIIAQWKSSSGNIQAEPLAKLRFMLQAPARFLAEYPKVSRVSIINNMANPKENDNTMQTVQGILPVLKQVMGGKLHKKELFLLAMQLISTIQHAFLRSEVYKKSFGFDFFNEKQRNHFVEKIVDNLILHKRIH